MIDVADQPWGPWTTVSRRRLAPRGGDPLMNTYHAHLMPWLSDGSLVVSVSQNARDMLRDAWPHPERYRLQFLGAALVATATRRHRRSTTTRRRRPATTTTTDDHDDDDHDRRPRPHRPIGDDVDAITALVQSTVLGVRHRPPARRRRRPRRRRRVASRDAGVASVDLRRARLTPTPSDAVALPGGAALRAEASRDGPRAGRVHRPDRARRPVSRPPNGRRPPGRAVHRASRGRGGRTGGSRLVRRPS